MNKKSFFIFLLIALIFLIDFVSAEITTINPDTVYPGDTIELVISPNKKIGFYNMIYVHGDEGAVVDIVQVPCDTICKKMKRVSYIVPANFLGDYYFATFDYTINDYGLDYFTVIEPGGAPQGKLTIQEIKNFGSDLNFLINPEEGKKANILISVNLEDRQCDLYNVDVYLCNSSLSSLCSSSVYTHKIPLQFASEKRKNCNFNYTGEDYFPFYEPAGDWKIIAESGPISDQRDFIYNTLAAITYPSFINFGTLNARMWNTGVPSSELDLINSGNLPVMIEWNSSGFPCISMGCTDFWSTFYDGENTFQIDDDDLFLEGTETGIEPVFITEFSVDYFPQAGLSVCISDSCNDDAGERVKTFYNLKIYDIERGVYQGDISVTLS